MRLDEPAPLARHRVSLRSPYFVGVPSRSAIALHLTMRLEGDRPVARSIAARRAAARSMLSVGRDHDLLAFALADTHLHLLTGSSAPAAVELARRIKIGLQRTLGLEAPFHPTRIRPVEDAWHLHRAIPYVIAQPERHAPGLDPCFEGTSLPDLLGLRVFDRGRLAQSVFELAPRLSKVELAAALGGAPDGDSNELDWTLLADAAAAAFALPSLLGRTALAVVARRAAVHAAADLTAGEVASLLGLAPSSVRQARSSPIEAVFVDAVRAQLRFRSVRARRAQDGVVAPETPG